MPTRIKPKVEEISLAFNPANKRKFILHKEEGGKEMKYAISLLSKDDQAANEKEFLVFLKDQKLSKEVEEGMLGAYRLLVMSKDGLPKTFTESLQKSFPAFSEFFGPKGAEKDVLAKMEKDLRVTLEKELRVSLDKEIRAAVEKEMGMTKDVEIKNLSVTVAALQKETDETKKLLVVEKDARRLAELVKEITGFGTPGEIAKLAKDVLDVEKTDAELGKRILTSYKESGVAFKTMQKAFDEIGSSGEGIIEGSAHEKLQKLAKDIMAVDKDLTMTAAFAKAAKANPAIYAEYNRDHYKKSVAH